MSYKIWLHWIQTKKAVDNLRQTPYPFQLKNGYKLVTLVTKEKVLKTSYHILLIVLLTAKSSQLAMSHQPLYFGHRSKQQIAIVLQKM